jgi:hypothetical protein
MSPTLAMRYPQNKPQCATIAGTEVEGRKKINGDTTPIPPILDAFTIAEGKAATLIVNQNFRETLNNETRTVSDTTMDRHHQSSAQVR